MLAAYTSGRLEIAKRNQSKLVPTRQNASLKTTMADSDAERIRTGRIAMPFYASSRLFVR